MKVLIVFEDNRETDNLFVPLLSRSIRSEGIDVYCSVCEFWTPHNNYDIIHFQWPEEIIGWNCKDLNIDEKLLKQIDFHKRNGAKIVYTRHDIRPRYGNPIIEIVYGIIEACSDLIVHMGLWSLEEFQMTYSNSKNIVIPHHLYEKVYNQSIDKAKARQILNIPNDKVVITAFGKFFNSEERTIVLKAYKQLKNKNKFLVAPRLYPLSKDPNPQQKIKSILSKIIYYLYIPLFEKIFNIKGGPSNCFIPHHQLPYYLAASDVIFIQRKDILNSGNITLGFFYRKVVLGPNTGNIGEILRQTGNPTFNPYHEKSISDALKEAVNLSKKGHGNKNYDYAIENCSLNKIGQMYVNAYRNLINKES